MTQFWRYSKRTPGRYNAMGATRIYRTPEAPHRARGELLDQTDASWLVRLEGETRTRYLSKRHCRLYSATGEFEIPAWLWAKMNEGKR